MSIEYYKCSTENGGKSAIIFIENNGSEQSHEM